MSATGPNKTHGTHDLRDVFISYARQDAAFAVRLQKTLLRYRAPLFSSLKPRRLRVFLDTSDIAGTRLDEALKSALRGSRKLIVLCSPNSRDRLWVNEEIRFFVELGRTNHIVPILVAGMANSEAARNGVPQDAAFPPALVSALGPDPLAPDFRSSYSESVTLDSVGDPWHQLLATLYGTTRELIEQRERNRRVVRATVACAIALIVVFAAQNLWRGWREDQSRTLAEKAGKATDRDDAIRTAISAVEMAPTEQALAASRAALSRTLNAIWDFQVAKEESAIAADDSGQTVAIASPTGGLQIGSSVEGTLYNVCRFTGPIREIVVSPNGKHVVWVDVPRKVVVFWDTGGRKLIEAAAPSKVGTSGHPQLSIDAQSRVVALGDYRNEGRLWRISNGMLIRELPSQFGDVITYSASGAYFTQHSSYESRNQSVAVWRSDDGYRQREYPIADRVQVAAVDERDARALFALSRERTFLELDIRGPGARVLDSPTMSPATLLPLTQTLMRQAVAIEPAPTHSQYMTWLRSAGRVFEAIATKAPVALATMGTDHFIVDAATLKRGPRISLEGRKVYGFTFSSDGRLLAGNGGGVWDTATGERLWPLPDERMAVEFSPDGTRLFAIISPNGDNDDVAKVYDARGGQELGRLDVASDYPRDQRPDSSRVLLKFLYLSNDGKRALLRSDHDVYVWDVGGRQKRIAGSYWDDIKQYNADREALNRALTADRALQLSSRWKRDCSQ